MKKWLERWLIRRELQKLEAKTPKIRAAIEWLSVPGRKRGIAVACGLLAGALRGVQKPLQDLCTAAAIAVDSAWCKANPDAWAYWVEGVNQAIQTYFVPGADLAFLAFGILGLLHARMRKK